MKIEVIGIAKIYYNTVTEKYECEAYIIENKRDITVRMYEK